MNKTQKQHINTKKKMTGGSSVIFGIIMILTAVLFLIILYTMIRSSKDTNLQVTEDYTRLNEAVDKFLQYLSAEQVSTDIKDNISNFLKTTNISASSIFKVNQNFYLKIHDSQLSI